MSRKAITIEARIAMAEARQRGVIALGSNLTDPANNLRSALTRLQSLSDAPVSASSIWKTAPVGFQEAVPDFCNAISVIETGLAAPELLASLQEIERDMGRQRNRTSHHELQYELRYESRSIDLDIIDLGGMVFSNEGLTLPHPRAHERQFVLLPLQELLPEFRFPTLDKSLDQLICEAPVIPVGKSIPLIPLD